MLKKIIFAFSAVLALSLAGCAELGGFTHHANKPVGSEASLMQMPQENIVVNAKGSAINQALLNSPIGEYLDPQDQLHAKHSILHTSMGKETKWSNRKSGVNYTVKPLKTYQAGESSCRQVLITAAIEHDEITDAAESHAERAYLTVCQTHTASV